MTSALPSRATRSSWNSRRWRRAPASEPATAGVELQYDNDIEVTAAVLDSPEGGLALAMRETGVTPVYLVVHVASDGKTVTEYNSEGTVTLDIETLKGSAVDSPDAHHSCRIGHCIFAALTWLSDSWYGWLVGEICEACMESVVALPVTAGASSRAFDSIVLGLHPRPCGSRDLVDDRVLRCAVFVLHGQYLRRPSPVTRSVLCLVDRREEPDNRHQRQRDRGRHRILLRRHYAELGWGRRLFGERVPVQQRVHRDRAALPLRLRGPPARRHGEPRLRPAVHLRPGSLQRRAGDRRAVLRRRGPSRQRRHQAGLRGAPVRTDDLPGGSICQTTTDEREVEECAFGCAPDNSSCAEPTQTTSCDSATCNGDRPKGDPVCTTNPGGHTGPDNSTVRDVLLPDRAGCVGLRVRSNCPSCVALR